MLHLSYLASALVNGLGQACEIVTAFTEIKGICLAHTGRATAMNSAIKTKDLLTLVFNQLYNECSLKDLEMVREVLFSEGKRCAVEILIPTDIDNNNILDKAVVYGNIELARLILDNTLFHVGEDLTHYFVDTIHTACFLGCTEIASLILKKCPEIAKVPGSPKFYPVAGPMGHKWEEYSVQHATYGHKLQRLHWMRTHPHELPVCYAISGDHADVVKSLLSQDSSYKDDVSLQYSLLQVACACASYKCIEVLSRLLPEGVNTRDPRGKSAIPLGLSHGVTYVSVLLYCGLNREILNDINGDQTTNALHIFYNDLAKDDKVYPKYRHLFKMTKLLVENGVSMNQTTSAFSSQSSHETPLHLLLDHLNLIITWNMGDYMPFEKWAKLQRYFDRAIPKAVNLILKSGIDLELHGHSLLERLFSNRNYLLRYKLSNDMDSLSYKQYGLGNVLAVAKLLFQNGAKLYCQRRTLTPLLSLVDGFHVVISPFRTFQLADFGDVFSGCVQILLANGCDPNIHPISRDNNSQYAAPLLHFLDLFSFNCCHEVKMFTPTSVEDIRAIISIFAKHGAKFSCHMSRNGHFIKHGIFDPLYPLLKVLMKSGNKDHLNLGLASMRHLVLFLTHCGAEVEFCEHASKTHALIGPEKVKFCVFYQWLALGATSILLENGHSSTHATDNAEFLAILGILGNQCNHQSFFASLREVVHYLDQHEVKKDQISFKSYEKYKTLLCGGYMSPPGLQMACRRIIYKACRTRYAENVNRLPLPAKLKEYLLLFQT